MLWKKYTHHQVWLPNTSTKLLAPPLSPGAPFGVGFNGGRAEGGALRVDEASRITSARLKASGVKGWLHKAGLWQQQNTFSGKIM